MRVVIPKPLPTSHSTEDLWRGRVSAWRRSGLTVAAFCADKPFAASTLRWWSSRLQRSPAPTFLELRPRGSVLAVPPAELVVEVGAARVRVASGFDPALLASVVAALAGDAR